jgi:hypothetical protein
VVVAKPFRTTAVGTMTLNFAPASGRSIAAAASSSTLVPVAAGAAGAGAGAARGRPVGCIRTLPPGPVSGTQPATCGRSGTFTSIRTLTIGGRPGTSSLSVASSTTTVSPAFTRM